MSETPHKLHLFVQKLFAISTSEREEICCGFRVKINLPSFGEFLYSQMLRIVIVRFFIFFDVSKIEFLE